MYVGAIYANGRETRSQSSSNTEPQSATNLKVSNRPPFLIACPQKKLQLHRAHQITGLCKSVHPWPSSPNWGHVSEIQSIKETPIAVEAAAIKKNGLHAHWHCLYGSPCKVNNAGRFADVLSKVRTQICKYPKHVMKRVTWQKPRPPSVSWSSCVRDFLKGPKNRIWLWLFCNCSIESLVVNSITRSHNMSKYWG